MRRNLMLLSTMALALLLAGAPALAALTDESAFCQDPQRVLQDRTETGDSTNTFTTTTNVFLVNYDGTGFDVAPNTTRYIRIIDNVTQRVLKFVPLDANAADSFIVNAPPGASGTYELDVDIDPQSAESEKTYIVSVDQCRGTTTNCQDPQEVFPQHVETGDSTNTFTTTTNAFLVNYDGTGFDPGPPGSTAQIRIQTTSGQDVDTQTFNANEETFFIVNAPPGTYELVVDLDPQDAETFMSYIVSVDQCGETTTPGTVGPRSGDNNTTFTTTGDVFRVNYDVIFDDAAPSTASAEIRIIDNDTQQVLEFIPLSASAADSIVVAQGAGTYRLEVDIDPDDAANYTVTVDDCATVDDCVGTTTAPKVISTFPRNGGEVGPAANIRATFSEDMRPASVMNAFKLFKKGSTNQIAAQVSYDAATDRATLNPTNNLKRGVTTRL